MGTSSDATPVHKNVLAKMVGLSLPSSLPPSLSPSIAPSPWEETHGH
jgi:hypothetical protein